MPDLQTLFAGLTDAHVDEARPKFFQMERSPGDVVIEEGESHDSMFLLDEGQVAVFVGGYEVARLGSGACIGEIGLFTTSVRTATVQAVTDVTFHLLSRPAFDALKASGNPVANHIEKLAVGQLGARLRQLISDIRSSAATARGLLLDPVQTRQTEGTAAPLPEATVIASLGAMSSFDDADADGLRAIAAVASHRVYREGDTIAQVGRRDGPLQLLVSGRVDCLVTLEVEQLRAATLSGGEIFNVLPFADGQPRPYSFVAASDCTTLTIDKATARELLDCEGPEATAMRMAMIRSLADRVNQANATFSLARLMGLEVDGDTPAPAPRALPRRAGRAALPPDPESEQPAVLMDVPPELDVAPVPPAPFEEGAPALTPPHRPAASARGAEPPAFDPRAFVQPAPLHLGQPVNPGASEGREGETPWFDGSKPEWDTWFELTDDVSL